MRTIEIPISESVSKELSDIVVEEARLAVSKILEMEKAYIGKEWLSQKECMEMLGISWSTFQNYRKMGLRVSEMSPRNIFVSKTEVNRFLFEHER